MDAIKTLKAALPTSRHVDMLVDGVCALLGDGAHVETADRQQRIRVFVRDPEAPEWILPWPILQFMRGRRLGYVMGGEGPPSDASPPGSEEPPLRLRGLTSGELAIFDGASEVSLTYGEDGRLAETSRSGPSEGLTHLAQALIRRGGNPVEILADHLAALDLTRSGPGRVLLPARCPSALEGTWLAALDALRDALLDESVATSSRWVALDGYARSVIRTGETRDEAVQRCREGIEQFRPRPPAPEPPPDPEKFARLGMEGVFLITGANRDAPDVDPTPENTPIATLSLSPMPDLPPPSGSWLPLLDDRGGSCPAVLVRNEHGLTVVGPDALGGPLDMATLHEALDDADRDAAPWIEETRQRDWPSELPRLDSEAMTYSFEDAPEGAPGARLRGIALSHGFHGRMLRADALTARVLRQHRVE